MNKITVETDRGNIEVSFENFESLYQVVSHQVGIFINDSKEFCSKLEQRVSEQWREKFLLGTFNLPNNSVILDIGAGVGLLDVVLLKYLNNNSTVYILDKSDFTKKHKHWGEDHGFYNNRQVTLDLIQSNNISPDKLKFIDIEDTWPRVLNLIISNNSYLWHYPKEIYWDKIRPYAISGCKLAFDIFNRPDSNYLQEIEDDISRKSIFSYRPTPANHWFQNELHDINNSYGRCCVWL